MKNLLVKKLTNENKTLLKLLMMLYKSCNNNCDFCFQKQFSYMPTIDKFKNDVDKYIQSAEQVLSEKKYDETTVNLMGGELFYTDYALEEIIKIVLAISKYDVEFRIATNLLYNDLAPLFKTIDILIENNIKFGMFSSYDFGDIRFHNDLMIKTFYCNLQKLKEYSNGRFTVGVEVTRTKHMLNSLKSNDLQHKVFDDVVNLVDSICLDELIGKFDYELSYDESIELWKLLIDNYPQLTDLKQHFIDTGRNCLNSLRIVIVDGNIYRGCISLKYALIDSTMEDKLNYALEHINRYNCINCKFYNRCPLKCPIERKYAKCDIKEILQYMKEYNIIL